MGWLHIKAWNACLEGWWSAACQSRTIIKEFREQLCFMLIIWLLVSWVGNRSLKTLNGLNDNWCESVKALKHHEFYTFRVLHQLCLYAFWIILKSTYEKTKKAILGVLVLNYDTGIYRVSTGSGQEQVPREDCDGDSLKWCFPRILYLGSCGSRIPLG